MARLDPFIGLPYSARHMDCADLVALVQRELFGRQVLLARDRPLRPHEQAGAIASYCSALGRRVEQPRDGDVVLMRSSGAPAPDHIGTWFLACHAPSVLHTSYTLGASVLHRLQDLGALGLHVEGVYRWL